MRSLWVLLLALSLMLCPATFLIAGDGMWDADKGGIDRDLDNDGSWDYPWGLDRDTDNTGHGITIREALTAISIMTVPGIMAPGVSTATWITTVYGTTAGAA